MNRYFEDHTLTDLIEGYEEFEQPKKLFGDFLHEGELGILFSDSGIGKTILTYDIAISVTQLLNYWRENMSETNAEVFIMDLEQAPGQISKRFKGFEDIKTDHIHIRSLHSESMGEVTPSILVSEIRGSANQGSLHIVDNVTSLIGSGLSINQTKALMADLKRIIAETGCTILLLAHTTKRNMKKPLTQNDLGGSKMLLNFVDTAFALSVSIKDDTTRYLKQIKARNCKRMDKVAELDIADDTYLHMEFVEWNNESDHLDKQNTRRTKYDKYDIADVLSLHEEGYSCREIANEIGISKSTINRIINQYNNGIKQS